MSDQSADQPAWRAFQVGSLIAGYRLEERIGAGGMAVVFRAYDARLDRQVALKLLAPGLDLDESLRRRFLVESRAAAAVDHPHIIPVFEAGESDGVLFIAMRYVRGLDVRTLIKQTGPLSPGLVADIVSQVASALDAAHARGLVHRDVKPANMLLEAQPADDLPDHVYLSDFGLTKASVGDATALTASGEFMGTLEYVAPEQIAGRVLDGRCDEYALACSSYEMLCGQPPFHREQSLGTVYAHLHEPPPQTLKYRAGLPAGVDFVLGRALAKKPDDRYPSCGDFAAALRQVLGSSSRGYRREGATGRPAEPARPQAGRRAKIAPSPARPGVTQRDLISALSAARGAGNSAEEDHDEHTLIGPDPAAITEPSPRPPHAGDARRQRWWRSPAVAAGLVVAALVLGGGGYLLSSRVHAGAATTRPPHHNAAAGALHVPGCTQATAAAPHPAAVTPTSVAVPGAFGIAVSGRYSFVSGGGAVTILQDGPAGAAPTRLRRIGVPGVGGGDAVTHNGQYLLAAAGSGAVVISIARAIQGAPAVVGRLISHGRGSAAEVALSPDDRFAFVTMEKSSALAVFNLQAALTSNFARSGFVGDVPVGLGPNGLATDGNSLFIADEGGAQLSIVSMNAAERGLTSAVSTSVSAGCQPARAMVAADGTLWVTAAASDALLGFSTAKLLSDPSHALIAVVRVGERPLGLALQPGGARIVVVDSDQNRVGGQSPNLAVVDVAKAVAGQQAVIDYIPIGVLPRNAAFAADGRTVLVTVTGSGSVQAVDLGALR